MKKGIILGMLGLLLFSILLIPSVLASTIVLDKTDYALTETASATINCAGNEKNQAYTINWTNITGFQVELDTGDTGDCTTFLENFIINSTFITTYGEVINVTIQGTNLEGTDNASVSSAGSNFLGITSITHQGTFLGRSSSIDSNVADENDKAISGGLCDVNVEDPSNDQVFFTVRSTMIDGNLDFIWNLDYNSFKENKDYVAKISCFCGSNESIYSCIDEDGGSVENSIGSSDVSFRTSDWLTFNEDPFNLTLDNTTIDELQTLFAGFDDIHWRINVSNNNPDSEPIEVIRRTILVKNDTRQIFGKINEGNIAGFLDGFTQGNSTSFRNHQLTQLAETGDYFIRIIYDVIYKNQFQVAQYIKSTNIFSITSVQDTFQISDTEVHDFFGVEVRLNSDTQSLSIAPTADNTTTHFVLSEAFDFDFCVLANNTRDDDIHVYVDELILENTVLNTTYLLIDESLNNQRILALENNSVDKEFCITEKLPNELDTHSDYRLNFNIHIGTEDEEFSCGEDCEFEGHTDYFYVLKLTDMIEMPKFINDPTATLDGNPGVRIVTERGEYLPMFDDINYTNQQDTDWGNRGTCQGKDGGGLQACNYTVFPNAGEKIKVCFEGRSYFSDEVFVNLFDLYLDSDQGDSQILFDVDIEVGIKSISDNDLYLGTAPSRALEADGNLTDGYATYCSSWLELPNDIIGGNSWDIQGRATLDPHLYSLSEDKNWDWESDEFPTYGRISSQPDWELHLFDPKHYNIPERWDRISENQYIFNLTIPSLGTNARTFNFGEHLPFRLLDESTPLERLVNVTVTYQNLSAIPHNTSLFVQFEQIIFLIENVNTSAGDNNFTITANTYDFTNRSVVALEGSRTALEGIEDKTGTFKLNVNCPNTAIAGDVVFCDIEAQVEDSQLVEKEVDFTCYINTNSGRASETNFNQMITIDLFKISRNFLVPGNLVVGEEHTLQCEASYFNLGSRTDRFSDTFTIVGDIGSTQVKGAGVVEAKENLIEDLVEDLKKIGKEIIDKGKNIFDDILKSPLLYLGLMGIFVFIVSIAIFFYAMSRKTRSEN